MYTENQHFVPHSSVKVTVLSILIKGTCFSYCIFIVAEEVSYDTIMQSPQLF